MPRDTDTRNARSRPDDPFGDDDWGNDNDSGTAQEPPEEVARPTVDPNRLPWLKPANVLPKRQGTLELVSYQGPSKYSDVTLVVKVGGKMFHLGLQTFDKSYLACQKKFGDKRSDWHGTLKYKVMPHKGNPDGFVAVRPV